MSFTLRLSSVLTLAFVSFFSSNADAQLSRECSYTCSSQCLVEARFQQREANAVLEACGARDPRPRPDPRPYPRPGARVSLYRSDSCSGSLVATVDSRTECDLIANGTESVWGIAVNGVCVDIADTQLRVACKAFRDVNDSYAVKFYRNDRCQGGLVASASHSGRCEELRGSLGTASVWAVEINGRCEDISDTSFYVACSRFAR